MIDFFANLILTGAEVKSLVSLIGFLVACVAVVLLYINRQETKRFELLPESDRLKYAQGILKNIDLDHLSKEQRDQLAHKWLDNSFRWRLALLVAAVVMFLVSMILLSFGGHEESVDSDIGAHIQKESPLDHCYYRLVALTKTFESLEDSPRAPQKVKEEGTRLVTCFSSIEDSQLPIIHRAIKYELLGWDWSMIARVYGDEGKYDIAAKYSSSAIEALETAVQIMDGVIARKETGDALAEEAFTYLIAGTSEDYNRSRYLLATSIATNAKVGGSRSAQEAVTILQQIPHYYLEEYPPQNNKYLSWALQQL